MATFDFRNMLRFLHCIIKKYSKNVPRTFRKPEDRKSDRRYATPRFPLRISSVNVTKFALSCGFGHIY